MKAIHKLYNRHFVTGLRKQKKGSSSDFRN